VSISRYNVKSVSSRNGQFIIDTDNSGQPQVSSKILIGAFGKTSGLNKILNRDFEGVKSPYNGVKLHLEEKYFKDYPKNEIHIYTGPGIYCGINKVNGNSVTVCFLDKRNSSDSSVKEKLISLRKVNKEFNRILTCEADEEILKAKVYGTGNIYFGSKQLVENGIFMAGDSAGVIAPLAGDGIGMAMESAKILADLLIKSPGENLSFLTGEYSRRWKRHFKRRLLIAGIIQNGMFNKILLNTGMKLLNIYPRSINKLIDYTRK
jgi:menaquinone-9 beta-reductase